MISPNRRRLGVYQHALHNTISVARSKWADRGHPTIQPGGRSAKKSPINHAESQTRSFVLLPDTTSVGKYRHSPAQQEFVHVGSASKINSRRYQYLGPRRNLCNLARPGNKAALPARLYRKPLGTEQEVNPSRCP
ncbi:Hypothetical protein CINCED_3A012930 [Cinara cedri]|uniref:Uncharacterized protein n=1 Tax=Cinara cedri TaxID=506608 RepID=A0A5E4M4N0_9HEMI|nr:Hypothetical protein CINCED_3A012930 [Cinara cedri]